MLLASLLLPPPCCFRRCCLFPTVIGVPAVADSLLSGVPAVAVSLIFIIRLPAIVVYLFLALLLLLVPYCCWRLCCFCFPAFTFPNFPLSLIKNCFKTKFCFHLYTPRDDISSFILLLGMIRNEFRKFSIPRKRQNFDEKPVSLVYSVFRGIISWSENGNLKMYGAESRIKRTVLIHLSTKIR